MILSCTNIKKSFGINEVLKDITFKIEDGEKIAIVGVNGAGKSTLFKIITKEIRYDSGELALSKNINTIGYLAQMQDLYDDCNIYDTFVEVFRPIIQLEEEIRQTEKQMAQKTGHELETLMKKYSALNDEFENKSGYEYKSRIRGVIKGLGFTEQDSEKTINMLSGGEKTRVSLGKLLLTNPDILLLDEPTNHLDIESIEWLEDYLKNYDGSVIIVSHDRYFINKVVNKIIEIENGKSHVYTGNYATFAKQKEIKRQIDLKHYLDQQKEIKKQEEVIKTLRQFNREKSIKRAESREKQLDKMDKIEKPENLPENMRLKIKPRRQSGKDVLDVMDLSKSFEDMSLFCNANFSVKKQDKVALIGPNGIGKSTLLKIILEEATKTSGTIKKGTNVVIAYYDQAQQELSEDKSIFDEVHDTYPKLTILEVRNALACFVFTGDDVFQKIGTLSGGEKGRVSLAKIMLSQANFLILDEPTNHLDMYSKDILEQTLNNYEGTILYVSHDRYFINNTADKILELSPNGVKTYLGNYDYYTEKRTETEQVEIQKKTPIVKEKDNKSDERKRKTQIRLIESDITSLEQGIENLDKLLATPEVAIDHIKTHELYENKLAIEQQLKELLLEWEQIQT